MPIGKKWSPANREHIKSNVPSKSGVYELYSFGEPVYVGSSRDLQGRLIEHLEKNPKKYRFKTVGFFGSRTSLEREHYDRHVEKHGKPPKWNDKRP